MRIHSFAPACRQAGKSPSLAAYGGMTGDEKLRRTISTSGRLHWLNYNLMAEGSQLFLCRLIFEGCRLKMGSSPGAGGVSSGEFFSGFFLIFVVYYIVQKEGDNEKRFFAGFKDSRQFRGWAVPV
jgi:hypothetical protein